MVERAGERVAVVGAGSFGTALASSLAAQGYAVSLWGRSAEVVGEINAKRTNSVYLGELPLAPGITATTQLEESVRDASLVLWATPSHVVRETLTRAAPALARNARMVCAAKGIEIDTLELMPAVMRAALGKRDDVSLVFLSGPSFAKEMVRGLHTNVVIAADELTLAEEVQQRLSSSTFRCYSSNDVVGVEIAGALKNIYAIAAGAAEAMGLGHNARAALITRGLNEMALLGVALGARPLTFAGLAGVGDLVLTCTGDLSRNRKVGVLLGQGVPPEQIMRDMRQVAEGVRTAKAVHALATARRVEMPIAQQIYRVLYEGKRVDVALAELAARELKQEWPDHVN